VTRKSITTSHAAVACDVCGRTLLRGEHADVFLSGGERRMVCELCTPRAAHEGWIREGLDLGSGARRGGDGRRRSLLGRLGRPRRENGYDLLPGGAEELLDETPAPRAAPAPAPAAPAPMPVYEPPREPRHVHAVPTNADLKMARALDVFNLSAHPRRIAGVTRSLGTPMVSVLPSEVEGAIVSIVVGWELCWYRYEVDLADEAAGVRVLGQGAELSELTPAEQLANAVADERGRLVLAA
jgi:hypothetical protein